MASATDPFGRPAEFASWYRDLYPRVVGLLTVAAGDAEVAKDAAAEAFARAYERWDRVSKHDSPGGWLYTVALNVVRRQARRREVEERLLRRVPPVRAANDEVPVSADLWKALRGLTLRQRTAIALRYLLDLPEAEVAQVMGVSRGAASATLSAARRALADRLADGPPERMRLAATSEQSAEP